ncbi:XrtX-associated membrane protein [Hymenobacter latericus]|uniref:XrtX-associated membrane protein n=1 Tax=Hymenobacter sp. YIM 151858-1 TaxID=2987688 RepID=UPI002227B651|nr:hypothetical protein [Hymenobacter sp. YIM 151858-1]UYZ57820.1 hypothetical protein OIS50_12180 [Hymenobacter sp. YIM 151858-1]
MRNPAALGALPRLLRVGLALVLAAVLFWAGTHDAVAITALARFWASAAETLGLQSGFWREQPNPAYALPGFTSLPAKFTYGAGYSFTCLLLLLVLTPARTWRVGAGIYGGLFLLSIVLVLVGKAAGSTSPAFALGRPIIDLTLNPLPVIVLTPLMHWLYPAGRQRA